MTASSYQNDCEARVGRRTSAASATKPASVTGTAAAAHAARADRPRGPGGQGRGSGRRSGNPGACWDILVDGTGGPRRRRERSLNARGPRALRPRSAPRATPRAPRRALRPPAPSARLPPAMPTPPEVLRLTAFSDDPAGGNPAGVVLDASGLDARRCSRSRPRWASRRPPS